MRGHEAETKYFMNVVFFDDALGTLKDIFEFFVHIADEDNINPNADINGSNRRFKYNDKVR